MGDTTMNGCCVDKKYGKGCTEQTCMSLPAGKTCGDCRHVVWCEGFLGSRFARTNTSCDWFPRRFVERQEVRG